MHQLIFSLCSLNLPFLALKMSYFCPALGRWVIPSDKILSISQEPYGGRLTPLGRLSHPSLIESFQAFVCERERFDSMHGLPIYTPAEIHIAIECLRRLDLSTTREFQRLMAVIRYWSGVLSENGDVHSMTNPAFFVGKFSSHDSVNVAPGVVMTQLHDEPKRVPISAPQSIELLPPPALVPFQPSPIDTPAMPDVEPELPKIERKKRILFQVPHRSQSAPVIETSKISPM